MKQYTGVNIDIPLHVVNIGVMTKSVPGYFFESHEGCSVDAARLSTLALAKDLVEP